MNKDLRNVLRQGDPVARERGLSAADLDRLRERVLTAQYPRLARGSALFLLASAATVVAMLVGVSVSKQGSLTHPAAHSATPQVVDSSIVVKQFQFSTPGGTKLIWTFNPNLDVR